MNNTELGQLGENLAEKHLTAKGYRILDRNFRYGKLEIDLIAQYDNKLIIVEVKTRNTAEIGEPWMAVTKRKQNQIIRAANHYVQSRDINAESRFDVVSIVHNSYRTVIEHIEEAFYPLI